MDNENRISNYITSVKSGVVNSEDMDSFEQFVYSQTEELRLLKIHNESLRNSLNQCEDEKRSLELQLVAEKTNRTQEAKNFDLEKEKVKMEFDTRVYSMKCEVELHKRKSEAIVMELDLLKEQLKTVEFEKGESLRQLHAITGNKNDFDQIKNSHDSFQKRMRETIKSLERQFSELRDVKEDMAISIDDSKQMVGKMNVSIKNLEHSRRRWEQRATELEKQLIHCQAENLQMKTKLERAESVRESSTALIDKMVVENENLYEGLNIFSTAIGKDINEADRQFVEKIHKIHKYTQDSVKRLKLE